MADALVTELLDTIGSFQEDALCPVCGGHGAMSQGSRDIVIELMPGAVVEGVKVSQGYDPDKRATLMAFTVTGHIGVSDATLAQQSWNGVEDELREAFDAFLVSLEKAAHARTLAAKLMKLDAQAKQRDWVVGPNGAKWGAPVNPKTPEQQMASMKEQEASLEAYQAVPYLPSNYGANPYYSVADAEEAFEVYKKGLGKQQGD